MLIPTGRHPESLRFLPVASRQPPVACDQLQPAGSFQFLTGWSDGSGTLGFVFLSACAYRSRSGIPPVVPCAAVSGGRHVRFQSFHTSGFWKSAMYFSVMMSASVVLATGWRP